MILDIQNSMTDKAYILYTKDIVLCGVITVQKLVINQRFFSITFQSKVEKVEIPYDHKTYHEAVELNCFWFRCIL